MLVFFSPSNKKAISLKKKPTYCRIIPVLLKKNDCGYMLKIRGTYRNMWKQFICEGRSYEWFLFFFVFFYIFPRFYEVPVLVISWEKLFACPLNYTLVLREWTWGMWSAAGRIHEGSFLGAHEIVELRIKQNEWILSVPTWALDRDLDPIILVEFATPSPLPSPLHRPRKGPSFGFLSRPLSACLP